MSFLAPLLRAWTFVLGPRTPAEREALKESRAFMLVVQIVVFAVYGAALVTRPNLRAPGPFALLTGLTLVHAIMHWYSPVVPHRPRRGMVYLPLHSLVAFGLVLHSGLVESAMALHAPLIGETVGMVRDWRKRAAIITLNLVLAATGYALLSGWAALPQAGPIALAITGFVILYVVLFTREVQAREHAQTLLGELEDAHSKLAEYAIQVEELTRAAERERIARDLHDTLSQGLAGLILQLEAATSHLEDDNPQRATTIVSDALDRARVALGEARQTIDVLRTATTPADLRNALRSEVDQFAATTGIACEVEIERLACLPAETRNHVLRIAAECLSNVARHAQANRVALTAGCKAGVFTLEISDDGKGFDAKSDTIPTGHYGLIGMRERARLTGGELIVTSKPQGGTRVRLTVRSEL